MRFVAKGDSNRIAADQVQELLGLPLADASRNSQDAWS